MSVRIGSGEGSQVEYDIDVEDGRIFYTTANTSHTFIRKGAQENTVEITLDDLKSHRVRGGQYYEKTKAEVERQLASATGETNDGIEDSK